MNQRKLTFYAFIGLLVSSVLLKKLIPLFIIILCLIWVWERDWSYKFRAIKQHGLLLTLPLLYLLFAFGMTYTKNMDYGIQKMETRLSLLLLPIVLPSLKSLNFSYYKRTFTKVFIATIFTAALICVFRAFYMYGVEAMAIRRGEDWGYFYKMRYFYGTIFSNFLMHPGYLAMYANVALITVLYQFKKQHSQRILLLKLSTVILLSLFIIMLYSKVGMAVLLIILLSFGVRYAIQMKRKIYILYSLFMVLVLAVGLYYVVPDSKVRLNILVESLSNQNHNPASTESTQLRIHAWKASRALIDESPFFGYGTGDIWDVLAKEYEVRGYTAALSKEVNAHNEFYQTALALGYLGLICLSSIFAYWFIYAWKKKHFPLFLWTLVTILAFMFESYLNTQDGVIYTSLFLFFVYALKHQDDE